MWVASKHGFFSIVQKGPNEWHVRARVKQDLENLFRAADYRRIDLSIKEWPKADYRFRVIVGKAVVAKLFVALAESIDYKNFKEQIGDLPDQKDKLSAYGNIWSMMYHFQPWEPDEDDWKDLRGAGDDPWSLRS